MVHSSGGDARLGARQPLVLLVVLHRPRLRRLRGCRRRGGLPLLLRTPMPWLLLSPPPSCALHAVVRDDLARAHAAVGAGTRRLCGRVARRSPLASRRPLVLKSCPLDAFLRHLVLVAALAAVDDAVAVRRAARAKARERRTPLLAAAARP